MFEVPHCAITAVQLTKHELSLETRQEKINMAADSIKCKFSLFDHFLPHT
jgi:hypothetical protein